MLFTRAQAFDCGFDAAAVRRRTKVRRWHRISEQVLSLPGYTRDFRWRLTAAVLDTPGDHAAASRDTVLMLHGHKAFREDTYAKLHVVTDNCRAHAPELAIVHRTRYLPPEHLTVVDGIRTTTVARALFDLAITTPFEKLVRVADMGWEQGLFTWSDARAMLEVLDVPGRPGISTMKAILGRRVWDHGTSERFSFLERRFRVLLDEKGIDRPRTHVELGDEDDRIGEVDTLWEDAKLIVELNGKLGHTSETSVTKDDDRRERLEAMGYKVREFSYADVVFRGDWVASEIVAELARRRSPAA